MRRKDREVSDINKILEILDRCSVCRLGLYDKRENEVYMVPLNFAYTLENRELTLYFHSARTGRKLDLLKENLSASFEMDCDHQLATHRLPCEYSYRYACLMGKGSVSFLTDASEKASILSLLMKKQSGKDFEISEKAAGSVAVFSLKADWFSCKINP